MKKAPLQAGIKTMWDANGTLTTLIPGGLHDGRLPPPSSTPYAQMMVTPGERQETSGPYIQTYELVITVWSKAGVTDAGAIQKALDLHFHRDRKHLLLVVGARVIDVQPMAGNIEEDPDKSEGKRVELATGHWTVWLQIDR